METADPAEPCVSKSALGKSYQVRKGLFWACVFSSDGWNLDKKGP